MIDIFNDICMLGASQSGSLMTCLFEYIYFSSLHSFSLEYTCENGQYIYIEYKKVETEKCQNEQILISVFIMKKKKKKLKLDKIMN